MKKEKFEKITEILIGMAHEIIEKENPTSEDIDDALSLLRDAKKYLQLVECLPNVS